MTKDLFDFLLGLKDDGRWKIARRVWYGVLFVAGLLIWGYILNWAQFPINFHDWTEVTSPRLGFFQNAVRTGQIPLHTYDQAGLRNLTDRYFAIPDVIVTPQLLLLGVMDIATYSLVHVWLLYAAGFVGLLWFARKNSFSPLIFSLVFFVFNFNGHIIAHIVIGHLTFASYFLFPWFLGLMQEWFEQKQGWAWVAKMSIWFYVLLLQGGIHQYVWCVLFVGVLAVVRWKGFWSAFWAMAFTGFLSLFRVLPALLIFTQFDSAFIGGYTSTRGLIRLLVTPTFPQYDFPIHYDFSRLGIWEFENYIGWAGLIFLGLGGLVWMVQSIRRRSIPWVLLPVAVLTWLSVGNHYQLFRSLHIPVFESERVSTRMLSLVIATLVFFVAAEVQRWIREGRWTKIGGLGLAAGLGGLAVWNIAELVPYALAWNIQWIVRLFPLDDFDLATKIVTNHADTPYVISLVAGLVLNLLAIGALVWLVRKEKRARV